MKEDESMHEISQGEAAKTSLSNRARSPRPALVHCRTNPRQVEAMLWDGVDVAPLREWGCMTTQPDNEGAIWIGALGEEEVLSKGWWVVKDPDDNLFWPEPPEKFERWFTPLGYEPIAHAENMQWLKNRQAATQATAPDASDAPLQAVSTESSLQPSTESVATLQQTLETRTKERDGLVEALRFVKAFFSNLDDDGGYYDPLSEARKKFHAPVHKKIDTALSQVKGE